MLNPIVLFLVMKRLDSRRSCGDLLKLHVVLSNRSVWTRNMCSLDKKAEHSNNSFPKYEVRMRVRDIQANLIKHERSPVVIATNQAIVARSAMAMKSRDGEPAYPKLVAEGS